MPQASLDQLGKIEAIFRDVRSDTPGCAVGVVRDGETVFAKGYGLACLEHGAPITPATRFYLASVSKQVTAFAVLLAAEAGRLELDDPVRTHIAELPRCMDGVTLRHLLTHTGGVRDYFNLGVLAGLGQEHTYTEDEVLRSLGRQGALNFTPGQDFLYSNSGYVLLAIALARVTGARLDAFARHEIFKPLGMDASRFQHDHAAVVPAKAFGYEQRSGQWRTANSRLDVVGDGGMYASLDDMLAWTRNLLSPRMGARAIDLMRSPARLTSGASTGYGMGLQIGAHRGLQTFGHGGALAGYRTELLAYPSAGLGVIVLFNDAAAWPALAARRVAEVFLADRMTPTATRPPAPSPEAIKARVGCYRALEGDVVSLVEQDGTLFIEGVPRALRPLGAESFALAGDPDLMRLAFEPGGRGLSVVSGAAPPRHYRRCEPSAEIDVETYIGDFQSRDVGKATCRVSANEAGLAVGFGNGQSVPLRPIGSDCLWAPDFGFALAFERDHDGATIGFRLDGGRVRGIHFVRAAEDREGL